MRTLYEIIESAKDGQKPTHEECYWAMLALSSLHFFDHHHIMQTVEHPNWVTDDFGRKMWADESLNCFKRALEKSPEEWVGVENDPSNPDYQEFRRSGKKLLDKILRDI